MSNHLGSAKRTIGSDPEFLSLKRQLEGIPGETFNYIKNNFTAGEIAQMTADVAGIFDPTPVSDGAGALIGLARGDWLSVGTSLLGMVPYLGDAGKVGKWISRGGKYMPIINKLAKYSNIKRKIAVLSQTKALRATRKEMWENYQRYKRGERCAKCVEAARKMNLPAGGRWAGEPGNSKWFPDANSNLKPDMQKLINDKGGVPFVEGMPDYSNFAVSLPGGGKTMPFEMTRGSGDIRKSFTQYKDMLQQTGKYDEAAFARLTDTHTWHHTPEGMQLVPKGLHNPTQGGPPHVGSRSWLGWSEY